MTDIPPKLAPDSRRLSISWLNALRDAVVSRTVRAGPGIMASRTSGGTTVSAERGGRRAVAPSSGAVGQCCCCRVRAAPANIDPPYLYRVDAYADGLSAAPTTRQMFVTAAADMGSLNAGSWILGLVADIKAFAAMPADEDDDN